jgi:biopolymer transport protein ExbB/TolQ
MEDAGLFFFGLIAAIAVIAIYIAFVRWLFKIEEHLLNQKKQIQLL